MSTQDVRRRRIRSGIGIALLLGIGLILNRSLPAQTPSAPAPSAQASIAGRVTDARTSAPVRGAAISLRAIRGGSRALPRAIADAEGRFVFRDLLPGQYAIEVSAVGYLNGGHGQSAPGGALQPIDIAAAGGTARTANVRLWRSASISGRVSIENDRPASGVTVEAIRTDIIENRGISASGMAGEDGTFRVAGLNPGDYLLAITAVFMTVNEIDGARLTGALPRNGQVGIGALLMPVGTAWLRYSPRPGSTPYVWFRDTTLIVRPAVFHPSAPVSDPRVIEIRAGDQIESIHLFWRAEPASSVSGVVRAADGAAGSVTVRAVREEFAWPSTRTRVLESAEMSTGPDGRFQLVGLAPGSYRIVASRLPSDNASNVAKAWAMTTVSIGQDAVRDLSLPLTPGLMVRGRVTTPPGMMMPDRVLRNMSVGFDAIGPLADAAPGTQGRVADDGQFEVGPLGPGRYVLFPPQAGGDWMFESALSRGREIDGAAVDVTANGIDDLVLTYTNRPMSVELRLTPASSQASDLIGLLFPEDRGRWTAAMLDSRRFQQCAISQSQPCSMSDVPPGQYFAIARPFASLPPTWRKPGVIEGLVSGAARVEVKRGENVTITVSARGVR